MKYSLNYPPSRSERYVICDVCGFKFHRKDTIKVSDIYNKQYGLIVCKNDYDKTNEQDRPFKVSETIITATDFIRDRSSETFVSNENDDRVPGKPLNGQCIANPVSPYIDLYWDAPFDNGSSAIIGYIIKRAEPQLSTLTIIQSDTGSSSAYYSDTDADIDSEYSYSVAAFNSFGIGAYSDEFFWPKLMGIWNDINYLTMSQSGDVLETSDTGYFIRVNHTEIGVL